MNGNGAHKRPAPPWKRKRKRHKRPAEAKLRDIRQRQDRISSVCHTAVSQDKTDNSPGFKIFNRAVAAFAVLIAALVISADTYNHEPPITADSAEIQIDQAEKMDQQYLVIAERTSLKPISEETIIQEYQQLPPTETEIERNRAPQYSENPASRADFNTSPIASPVSEAVIKPPISAPVSTVSMQVAANAASAVATPIPASVTSVAAFPTTVPTTRSLAVSSATNLAPIMQQSVSQMQPLASLNLPLMPSDPITYRVYLPVVINGADMMAPAAAPTPTPSPTRTPTPTPTPIGPLPYSPVDLVRALEAQPTRTVDRQSKIGVGVYADGGGHAMNELLKLRPGVVLLVDPKPEFAREIRKQLPKAFIFGRRYVEYQPLDNPEVRGAQFADYVAQLAVPLKGVVDGWMSYNEPVGRGDIAGYQAYNTFQVAFAKRLQGTYGIGAVAGNDPPGAIDILEYPKYFAEAIRISKFFGIHAYSSPNSQWLREPEASWYVLRYRRIHSALEQAGIRSGPIVLTEVGLAKGWREMGLNEEAVVADMTWFTDEVAKDDYVLGYTIFGIFTTSGWEAFNLSGTSILGRLSRYDPAKPLSITVTPTSTPNR